MPITPDASPLIQRGMQPRRTLVIGLLAATLVAVALLLFSHLSAQAQVQDGRGALTGLTLTSDTPGELIIAWDQANPEPTDYRVNWAREGEDFPSWGDTSGNSLPAGESQTLTGLDEGGTYKVRVRARYHQGQYEADPWSRPWVQRSQQVASTPETTPEPTSQPSQEDPPQEDPPRVQQNDKDSGAKSKDRIERSSDLDDSDDTCPDADNAPEPTAVAVEAVPIVVASTTAEYFVLYALYELDTETTVELPVLVKRGAAGTTTLAENVAALPKERYRVEQYLIADPGDVDGDCTDDITELDSLGRMNPVNPAAAIDFKDGLVAVPDRATFDALAARQRFLKFIIFDIDTDRPGIYFINTTTHTLHNTFLDTVGLKRSEVILGHMVYQAELVAPDGSRGVYYYWGVGPSEPFSSAARTYTVTAAGMPLLNDNLAFYLVSGALPFLQSDLPSYRASRINLVFTEDISVGIRYAALNPGEGYGRLRVMGPGQRPNPRDIVLYEALPNELPRVAGILSTVLQTPLSHVNLRAVQDAIPNAFVRGALDDSSIASLVDSYVHYEVTEEWYSIRAATKAEVDAHYASSRPTRPQTPQRDLSVREITPLSEIGFDDWEAFGVKAANVAVLGTLGFPEGTVPDGFAIPFYFYDEFMKHNKFYTRIQTMLDGEEFRTNFDTQEAKLKKLRKDIEDAETPQWIIEALTTMNESFAQGVNRRYRSSTNNEDLPGFSGAGLYDSKSQKPSEDGKDLAKSLKEVYASLWNFRAFIERDFNRIDHLAAAMGILVHPSYQDELVNGVAVSFDPFSSRDDNYYYVNSQVGEDLVTNPEPHSVPEEILLEEGGRYNVLATSNLVKPGKLLMSAAQVPQLREHLEVIHDHFKGLYNPGPGEQFAMEIEFKITSDNILAIKQARPWVFGTASSTPSPPTITTTSSSATGLRQPENRTSRLYTYRATDPEGGTITWSVGGIDGQVFTIDEQGQFSFKETSPPNFEIPGDSGRDNIYDVTVQARDDQSNTATLSVTVTVTDVNEGPAVTGRNSYTVEENQELSGADFFATDPEGDSVARWSLSGTDQGDFNISQDGELTFRNTPNYESPSDSNRNNEYLVTVRASDGQYTGMLNVTVTVRDVNEAPVLDGPDTVDDFPENASTSRQVARYTASDPERATVTLSLTGTDSDDFTLASNGVLTFNTSPDYEDQSSYSVTVRAEAGIHTGNSATRKRVTVNLQNVEERGTVTLSAVQPQERTGLTATLDDDDDPTGITWQWYRTSSRGSTGTAITSATFRFYTPVADDVGSYLRAVASYDDGHGTGKTASAVSANRVQAAPPDPEPPVFPVDGNYGRSIRENTRAGANLGAPVRATDGNNDRLTYSIPPSIYFEIDASTGQLRTKAELDHEDEDEYTVTVTATDPGGGTGTVTVTITVTDVNEGPEVSGRNSYTVEENQELSGADFFATDPEGDSVARWSLSGTDRGDFNISQDGELTFRNTPNYESPSDSNRNNEYLVTVRASDGQYTGMLNVAVTVRDANEAPEFASSSKSRTSFTYPENSTYALYTYQATDPEGGTITWSVSGTDGGDFDIGESGALSFANVPDFEAPVDANGDNEYLVTVQARDDGFNFDRLEVTVNVTNSIGTEEPTITTTSRPALTYQENGARAVYTYSANDPQRGIIVWSVTGTDVHALTITSDSSGRGVLTFISPPDFENPADSNSDNLYEIAVVATDEQGLTDSIDVTVTVTNHAESVEPTISTRRPPTTYRENRTSTVYNFRASDPQRGPIAWSRTGMDASAFALSDSGGLTFAGPPDFESPGDSDRQNDYELTVVATDEDGHSDRLAFTITVTDVNEGPEITRVGSAPGSVAENYGQTQVLARYTAIDPEDTSAQISRWNTSGRDGGDFVMNEQGELRFRYSPDYERPADSNRDNVYEVTVRAYDGRYYGTFEETITVTSVNEAPTITTTSSSATGLRQPENQTSRLYTYRATDPEGSSITWSVGGTDDGFFTIDERGQFSFSETSPPDFEFPGDSGGDNVYNVTVQASDGTHTESVAVMVNVTDVNEGPEISGTQTLGFDENRATDQVLARYTGRDPENPGTPINRWSTSGTDGGDFTINEDGELTFLNVPDYERPADSNRDNIYTFSVRAYDGRYYGYHEVTVTVDDLDEITGPSTLDRSENFEGLLATYSATGLGGLTVVPAWRLTGTDSGDFSISEQGELTFRSTPDYEGPADSNRDNVYNFDVQVSDGGYYGSHDVTVRVTPVNEPPSITTTSRTSFTQPENRISTLYTFRATDPEGGTVAWSAGGPDGGDFTIVGGALRFGTEPDFESPTGANGNEYLVTVRAEDAQGNPDTLEVTVTVTAVDEGPEVTSGREQLHRPGETGEWTRRERLEPGQLHGAPVCLRPGGWHRVPL